MKFPVTLTALFICVLVAQTLASSDNNNSGDLRQSKEQQLASANKLSHRQPRQDEEEEEEEEAVTTHRPALYPLLVKLFATSIGANETQANRTAERFVETHNGINRTISTTTTGPTKLNVGEEEEEEDEDEDSQKSN